MPGTDHATILEFESLVDYQSGSVVSRSIMAQKGGNVTLFAFARGEALSEHTAPFDALVQIVAGMARVTIDGTAFELQANQAIILPANVPHAVEAPEDMKMLLTMIKTDKKS